MFASSAWSLALLSLLDTGVQALSSNDSGSNIRPYTINVDPSFLEETRAKVSTFRPSVDINAPAWFDGPPVANMTALAKYWANDYVSSQILRWSSLFGNFNSSSCSFAIKNANKLCLLFRTGWRNNLASTAISPTTWRVYRLLRARTTTRRLWIFTSSTSAANEPTLSVSNKN
jgi:hypothetical protein